ncbi:MAG TPA: exodeoxyribonuclease VII large subunit [Candidatus Limnocylindria bacterium]|nr:exodeoxyribonuclease VII large subunit [Candidatus Limnocylindria bacterium]
MQELILGVSDFVAIFNQTIEYAYPSVTVVGELANLRVSKNRWVYFDLKDEGASVKFFGTVYQLPGPLEDGLMVQVNGTPRLHPLYGFSVTVQNMRPVGEGSLKRAAALLEAKLRAEGLFDTSRKRPLPYPPRRIGLITSAESAAYHDFIKILDERWGGIQIELADVQVQGDPAPAQLTAALEYFNTHEDPVDAIVVTRGGGSAEDLAAFSTEQVTRAIAVSRIPTIVAIGHEVDVGLAELAADQRASTPSNAAQLLVPDKRHVLEQLEQVRLSLGGHLQRSVADAQTRLYTRAEVLTLAIGQRLRGLDHALGLHRQVLAALSPTAALKRGYALITQQGKAVKTVKDLRAGDTIQVTLHDGSVKAEVK